MTKTYKIANVFGCQVGPFWVLGSKWLKFSRVDPEHSRPVHVKERQVGDRLQQQNRQRHPETCGWPSDDYTMLVAKLNTKLVGHTNAALPEAMVG